MPKQIILFLILICCVSSLDNGLGKTPQMGWNSWNHFACNIDEEVIKRTADAMVSSGFVDKGYVYLNLDDCWQLSRDTTTGRIQEDKEKFPSGIKTLSNYVHSKGMKFGLYSSAGTKTCEGRPGGLYFEEIDAQVYEEWEVDYLKYDNCFNEFLPGIIRYTRMRDALLKISRKIFYSICSWGEESIEKWGESVGNSWRTTGDIKDNWNSFLDILDKQVGLEAFAKPGGWNDPDMLEVGNSGMTDSEYQAHFALWALLKAPLIIGCDVTNMTEGTKRILLNEKIIAINQDSLGKQGKRYKSDQTSTGNLEIWAGELSTGYAIILFNRSSHSQKMTVVFSEVEYKFPGGNLQNLITDENYGYVEGSFTTDVESHSVVVLKLHTYCTEFMNCPQEQS